MVFCFQANTRLRSASAGYVLLEAGLPFLYTLDFLLDSQSVWHSLSSPLHSDTHRSVISSTPLPQVMYSGVDGALPFWEVIDLYNT